MFLIVSELFNNALDHGVLGLDSRTKSLEGGFERYLEERERRLAELNDGVIDIGFHLHMADQRPFLDIQVRDSGRGFDYHAYIDAPDDDQSLYQTHGRGIRLVKTLCEEVTYKDNGNRVFARYAL
ncbi:ATP-binding protein [Parasulfuritortus cantonensis]|uniref:ATP-binding protein n=1 Tax=Parasulfuritortus cantonensis TaxID=2528202 RepID=UPI001404C35F|nr:ATP-binding protein [Parasulfuritortus cantonensis]